MIWTLVSQSCATSSCEFGFKSSIRLDHLLSLHLPALLRLSKFDNHWNLPFSYSTHSCEFVSLKPWVYQQLFTLVLCDACFRVAIYATMWSIGMFWGPNCRPCSALFVNLSWITLEWHPFVIATEYLFCVARKLFLWRWQGIELA